MDEHKPVLLHEVIEYLSPKENDNFVDCTVGLGGHAEKILEATGPKGILLGIDQDESALDRAKARLRSFRDRFQPFYGNFTEIESVTVGLPINGGILADLGVSSWQLDNAERGFSFLKEAAIDMRMDRKGSLTGSTVVNDYSQESIRQILAKYGDERFAAKIATEIVQRRVKQPILKTTDLAGIVEKSIPRRYWPKKIHPATRTFQAIRIEVNNELKNLERFLPAAANLLEPGARIAIITFQSREDQMVKKFFKHEENPCTCPPEFPECRCDARPTLKIINRKAISAKEDEIKNNPRSRSARLRVAEKI